MNIQFRAFLLNGPSSGTIYKLPFHVPKITVLIPKLTGNDTFEPFEPYLYKEVFYNRFFNVGLFYLGDEYLNSRRVVKEFLKMLLKRFIKKVKLR